MIRGLCFAMFALVLGCGSSSTPSSNGGTGSCTTTSTAGGATRMSCTDYSMNTSTVNYQSLCTTTLMGTWSASACPTANRVGRCRLTSSLVTSTQNFYAPMTVDEARMDCTQSTGTFEAN